MTPTPTERAKRIDGLLVGLEYAIADSINAAVLDEREACAKVVEDFSEPLPTQGDLICGLLASNECIGRYLPKDQRTGAFGHGNPGVKEPCDYAGYGLLRLSPVEIEFPNGTKTHCFAFAVPGLDQ